MSKLFCVCVNDLASKTSYAHCTLTQNNFQVKRRVTVRTEEENGQESNNDGNNDGQYHPICVRVRLSGPDGT